MLDKQVDHVVCHLFVSKWKQLDAHGTLLIVLTANIAK